MAKEILGILFRMLRALGLMCLAPLAIAMYYVEREPVAVFFTLFFLLFATFSILLKLFDYGKAKRRHAIIALAITWLSYALISAVPFILMGFSPVDSVFESMSGWTGTGLSVLGDPSGIFHALNFWRCFMQWVGGIGIVVMALLVYERPANASQLFRAEGRTEDFYLNFYKIAKAIFAIYLVLSLASFALFLVAGVPAFDAVAHTMSTISTGGFSTNRIGIGYYGTGAAAAAVAVMLLGGISFLSHYKLLRGKLNEVLANPELRFMFALLALASSLIALDIYNTGTLDYFDGIFYSVSALTGSGAGIGFSVSQFPQMSIVVLIILMAFGACYGSTTGALKLWRVMILYGAVRQEVRKHLLPRGATVPFRIGGTTISDESALHALSYTLLYIAILFAGGLVFMLFGFSALDSFFSVAAAQGNVGLSLYDQAVLPELLKWLLIFHMYVGRLEIIPLLVLLRSMSEVRRI